MANTLSYPPLHQISIRRNESNHSLNSDDVTDPAYGLPIHPSSMSPRRLPRLTPRREPMNVSTQSFHATRVCRTRRPSRGGSPYPIRISPPNTTTSVSSFNDSDDEIMSSRSVTNFPRDEMEMLKRSRCPCPRSPLLVTPQHDFLVDNKCIISPTFGRSAAQNDNISIVDKCPICLENLCSTSPKKGICATVPCGHLFHAECFQKWQSCKKNTTSTRQSQHCNCPICNREISDFVRLYLTCEEVNPTNYDAGRNSISSDDDDLELYKVKAETNQLKKENERLVKEDAKRKRELHQIKLELKMMKRLRDPGPMKKIAETFANAKNGMNYVLKCISRGCRRSSHHSNSHDILSVLSFDDDYDFSVIFSDDENETISVDSQDESLMVPTLLF